MGFFDTMKPTFRWKTSFACIVFAVIFYSSERPWLGTALSLALGLAWKYTNLIDWSATRGAALSAVWTCYLSQCRFITYVRCFLSRLVRVKFDLAGSFQITKVTKAVEKSVPTRSVRNPWHLSQIRDPKVPLGSHFRFVEQNTVLLQCFFNAV